MKITLKNDCFSAVIDTQGAQLNSFVSKKNGTHYIWDGSEAVWKYHAPVLFPHVGRIKDGFMIYEGGRYALKVNGFSRDMEHTLLQSTDTKADFILKNSTQTQDKYPFSFTLITHYELKENGLVFTTTVKNTDTKDISFSLGSHSAFCCPRNTDPKDTKNSDYEIVFQNKKPLMQVLCTQEGYLDCSTQDDAIPTALYGEKSAGVIPLNEKGFGNGHFFTNFNSDWVALHSKKDDSFIKVNTKGYPYLMIWQNAGEPCFVCIEPWYGTPDCDKTTHQWKDKKALVTLPPDKEFTSDQSFIIE